jgi:jumonji domain-containing protein 2
MFTIQDKIHECPILKPNEKQFQNFFEYVTWAENKYRDQYGMVRVVPPKSWKPNSRASKDNLDNLIVSGPI